MSRTYTFVIPVYNRPQEIRELLMSFLELEGVFDFEILIIEDGSTLTSKSVVEAFITRLKISYHFKPNSGPGDSRNYGMSISKADYFIILDSDVILPPHYLLAVDDALNTHHFDCYGGPDQSHKDFSTTQKAIDFSMTSFLTTGGIRGNKHSQTSSYEPRSFNMGISRKAFIASGGFGKIHPGEDPDLSIRLKNLGFNLGFIPEAYVYHKRRIDLNKFYSQVSKFGRVRPILMKWHPECYKITFLFPSLFCLGLLISFMLIPLSLSLLVLYGIYFLLVFLSSLFKYRSFNVALLTIFAVLVQFFGYGIAFAKSYFKILILKQNPQKVYPNLFFK
ncbi:Glycosyltransferase, catalytic subunit of cellulose synthase and poly-beta-1,6-N-acetylglucosamine synthase [Psychroflexus salarius]|uniref:Glycosyltransferase, catalytic subunit of cellulose synthase and poly-beta-1,6-N-acetylglucosamine synthase n=1 Tax=Psychroflexus salarius TaxID=1155689 RepID=A0A1M4W650_9FLAO|nr:glycosyltransferase [Psychroflexus salarius]SHE76630.1 Glycosyltransferase, catalytic subunit of cellulose synthase and poly-beta-1,6-N-acetylglucosamine synthase [Psychroflexus salarius]